MEMRTIVIHQRKCGKRKPGHVYVVSEPGTGELPIVTLIDPPIPYPAPQFRGIITVDVDMILAGEPYPTYLVGSSGLRMQKTIIREPEIAAYGMTLKRRQEIGICAKEGLGQLGKLYPRNPSAIGTALRALSDSYKFKTCRIEVPVAWRALQDGKFTDALAAIWRLWEGTPMSRKTGVRVWVAMFMSALNASGDVGFLQ